MNDPAPADHDLARTCPKAKWHAEERRAEFGTSGLPICGIVDNDVPNAVVFGWYYAVSCPVFKLHRRGRHADRASCVADAKNLLEELGCPGQVSGSATE